MRSALVLLLVLCFGASVVSADQTDTRLEQLFQQLRAAPGAMAAQPIEKEIWMIWTRNGNRDVDHRMAIGIARMNQGDLDASYEAFDRVVEMMPRFAEGWNKRATVNYLIGNYDDSVRDIERTLALEPRHFGALSGMGLIFEAVGNGAAAVRAWERALEIHPHLVGIRQRLRDMKEALTGKPI